MRTMIVLLMLSTAAFTPAAWAQELSQAEWKELIDACR